MTQEKTQRVREGLTQRGERTRQRLLDAARDVFIEMGYEAANIDCIAERAGVGHGTFYLYFASKEDIFVAISRDLARGMTDAPAAPPPEPMSRLDRIRHANAAYLRDVLQNRRLTGELLSQSTRIPELAEQLTEMRDRAAHSVAATLRNRQARGEALGIDPEIAAYALTGMVSWFAFDWLYRECFPFDESRFDDVVDTLSRIWFEAEQAGLLTELVNGALAEPAQNGRRNDNESAAEV